MREAQGLLRVQRLAMKRRETGQYALQESRRTPERVHLRVCTPCTALAAQLPQGPPPCRAASPCALALLHRLPHALARGVDQGHQANKHKVLVAGKGGGQRRDAGETSSRDLLLSSPPPPTLFPCCSCLPPHATRCRASRHAQSWALACW